jgi:hypothetical protein
VARVTHTEGQALFQQEWQQSEQERKADELAQRYHDQTEAFDRTVCTGPILHGSIMPVTPHEMAQVNRNAILVRKQIMLEAGQHGITAAEMRHAIAKLA